MIVVGSLLASQAGKVVSLNAWSGIVLVLSGLASLLSVALFAISEIFIGSLCLMCVGLYLVNFLTFGFVWRAAWGGRVREGIRLGVSDAIKLVGVTVGLVHAPPSTKPWLVRATAILIALIGVVSVALPEALLNVYAAQDTTPRDPMEEWQEAPVAPLELKLSEGAFGDYYLGDPQAPIQIVEFADYECPACKRMHELMKDLLEKYKRTIPLCVQELSARSSV